MNHDFKVAQKEVGEIEKKSIPEDKTSLYCILNYNEACNEAIVLYSENQKFNLKVKGNENGFSVYFKETKIAENNDIKLLNEYITEVPMEISEGELVIDIPTYVLKESICSDLNNSSIEVYAKEHNFDLEKLEYLKLNEVPYKVIKLLIDKVGSKSVSKPDDLYIDVSKDKLVVGLITILNKKHLRLFGEKSTGKNTYADSLIWLLGRNVIRFPGSLNCDESKLVGDVSLITTTDAKGETHVITKFQERALVTAMKEGSCLLLDECNLINPATLGVLHGPMDKGRCLLLDTGEVIKAHDDFCVIVTMNEDYHGVKELNQALLDRTNGLEFASLENISSIIKILNPKTSESELNYIDNIYIKMKELVAKSALLDGVPYSIRGFLDFIELLHYGVNRENALRSAIINKIGNEIDRQTVYSSIFIC